MQSGGFSPFWSIFGLLIWIAILALPIIIYLVIAEYQRARRRRDEPSFKLGERLDRDLGKGLDKDFDKDRDGRNRRAG